MLFSTPSTLHVPQICPSIYSLSSLDHYLQLLLSEHPNPPSIQGVKMSYTLRSYHRASMPKATCTTMPLVSLFVIPAHLLDLLSLSGASPNPSSVSLPKASPSAPLIPSSVPATSVLSATRPPTSVNASVVAPTPKARRMSSSTTGVLGRGKLGATGEGSLGLGGLSRER